MQMANLINSLTNDKLNLLNGRSVPTKELGKLTKLANEIKLIEGFQPIKVTGSREIFVEQKPAQLLEARTINNKAFTLIVENKSLPLDSMKQVGLNLDSKNNRVTLSFTEAENSTKTATNTQIKANNNSQLAASPPLKNNINKHYNDYSSTTKTTIRDPATQAVPATTKRIEVPTRLTSKIETLNVIGKVTTPESSQHKTSEPHAQVFSKEQPAQNQFTRNLLNNGHQQVESPTKKTTNSPSLPQTFASTENEIQLKTDENKPNSRIFIAQPSMEQKLPTQAQGQANTSNQTPKYIDQPKTENQAVKPNFTQPQVSQSTEPLLKQETKLPLPLIQRHVDTKTSSHDQNQVTLESKISPSLDTRFYKVALNANEFILSASQPLKEGSKVQIIRDSQGNIQLLPPRQESTANTLTNALAKSLPQQLPKAELTQLIQSLTTMTNDKNLDIGVRQQIQQLIQSFPSPQNLQTPDAVKQAINNSGLFLESKLLNSTPNLTQDIKANWINVQTAVTQTQEDSLLNSRTESFDKKIENSVSHALERITSSQIRNLLESSKQEGINLPLIIEIPIQDKGKTSVFQLEIDQDKSNQEKPNKKRNWLAKLLFDFPETGKFEARVNVEENKVAVIFVAENKETDNQIKQSSNLLAKQLADKGLEVTQLESFVSPNKTRTEKVKQHNLIDVRT